MKTKLKTSESIIYYLLKVWIRCIGLFPFWFLYFKSTICFYLLFYVIRYRRRVVNKNITNSFPDKTYAERIAIEKDFYRHLCDWFFETCKFASMKPNEVKKRMTFVNVDLLYSLSAKGKSGYVLMGHCGNWEYITSLPLWGGHIDNLLFAHVYRPLHNKGVDRFFRELRGRLGSENIADTELFRETVRLKNAKHPYTIGILSDQIPRVEAKYHWMRFLNQETAIYTGSTKIAQKMGGFIVYAEIKKVHRGYYETSFRVLAENASEYNEIELAEQYMRCLESTINNNPPYYLWTHNRWKRSKEDFNRTHL